MQQTCSTCGTKTPDSVASSLHFYETHYKSDNPNFGPVKPGLAIDDYESD